HTGGFGRGVRALHHQHGVQHRKSCEGESEHSHEHEGQDAAGLQCPIAAESSCCHDEPRWKSKYRLSIISKVDKKASPISSRRFDSVERPPYMALTARPLRARRAHVRGPSTDGSGGFSARCVINAAAPVPEGTR